MQTIELTPDNMGIDAMYTELLSRLPAALAEGLSNRYKKDNEEFNKEALEAQVSTEVSYWAKPSCNKCYGRGIKGILRRHTFKKELKSGFRTPGTPLRCRCAEKRYFKWLKAFRVEFNKKRETENETT